MVREPAAVVALAGTAGSSSVRGPAGPVKHEVSITENISVGELKELLQERTGVPCEGQKLIYRGV